MTMGQVQVLRPLNNSGLLPKLELTQQGRIKFILPDIKVEVIVSGEPALNAVSGEILRVIRRHRVGELLRELRGNRSVRFDQNGISSDGFEKAFPEVTYKSFETLRAELSGVIQRLYFVPN